MSAFPETGFCPLAPAGISLPGFLQGAIGACGLGIVVAGATLEKWSLLHWVIRCDARCGSNVGNPAFAVNSRAASSCHFSPEAVV
jgi:hypothetical protein